MVSIGTILLTKIMKGEAEPAATVSTVVVTVVVLVFGEVNSKMSQEELVLLVEEVEQEGTLDTDEGELIRNAIEFSEQQAEDILEEIVGEIWYEHDEVVETQEV